jgi:hypothetical protein
MLFIEIFFVMDDYIVENQRIRSALEYMKKTGIIQFNQDLAAALGVDKYRINYITKDGGGKFTAPEINLLKQNYPQINWDFVITGQGTMLAEDNSIKLVAERALIYGKKPDLDQVLSEIITGSSILPVAEQLKIARNEIVRLQQKIIALIKL